MEQNSRSPTTHTLISPLQGQARSHRRGALKGSRPRQQEGERASQRVPARATPRLPAPRAHRRALGKGRRPHSAAASALGSQLAPSSPTPTAALTGTPSGHRSLQDTPETDPRLPSDQASRGLLPAPPSPLAPGRLPAALSSAPAL